MKKMPWGWVTDNEFNKEKQDFSKMLKGGLIDFYQSDKLGNIVFNKYKYFIDEIFGFAPDDTNEDSVFIAEHYGPEFYLDQIIEAEESTIKYYPNGTASFAWQYTIDMISC